MVPRRLPDTLPGLERSARPVSHALEKVDHAAPCVFRGIRVGRSLPVEERVRRTGVRNQCVLHSDFGQRAVELLDVFRRDPLVGATHQAKQWHMEVLHSRNHRL